MAEDGLARHLVVCRAIDVFIAGRIEVLGSEICVRVSRRSTTGKYSSELKAEKVLPKTLPQTEAQVVPASFWDPHWCIGDRDHEQHCCVRNDHTTTQSAIVDNCGILWISSERQPIARHSLLHAKLVGSRGVSPHL
jgi:hypothetical protein